MPIELSGLFRSEPAIRWVEYFVKAIVLFIAFFFVAQLLPTMPPLCVAVVWAVLSAATAIRPVYHFVIKKLYRQHGLNPAGFFARINAGRALSFTVAFVISAVCVAALLIEAPTWKPVEWVIAFTVIPFYPVVFAAADKLVKTSVEPVYQLSQTMKISCVAMGTVLCLAFLLVTLQSGSAQYESFMQAFLQTKQPFSESPTRLLVMAGDYNQVAEALTTYAISGSSIISTELGVAFSTITHIAASFGIARLFGACLLQVSEMRLAFLPLDAASKDEADYPPVKSFIVISCILPIALVAGFLAAEPRAEIIVESEEYDVFKVFIRDQIENTILVVNNEYILNATKFAALVNTARDEMSRLASQRDAELKPLLDAIYDKYIENVDDYLDWYYSLDADVNRLAGFFSGSIEEDMKEKFKSTINQGVDETEFREKCAYYIEEYKKAVADLETQIAKNRLSDELAEKYARAQVQRVDFQEIAKSLEPNQKFLEESEDLKNGVGFALETGRYAGFFDAFIFLPVDSAINREAYKQKIVDAINEDRNTLMEEISGSNESIKNYLDELLPSGM